MQDILKLGYINENIDIEVLEQLQIECKYEGYIKKQIEQIQKFESLENKKLAADLNYDDVIGLSTEARYKLKRIVPLSLGQASRVPGVSPSDINVLLIHLQKMRRK